MPLDGWPDTTGALPDESLPEGAAVDVATPGPDVDAIFDVIVVGSGAAGAVAAFRLAASGCSVAIVEEGPWIFSRDMKEDLLDGFRTLFRDAGMQALEGRAFMPLLQGRCVGGSTVINSAIAWRAPEEVLSDWAARFGVGPTMHELEPHYRALEAELSVQPVADHVLGENNRRLLASRGFESGGAGLEPSVMRRYDGGCEGSGRCLTGCPNGKKQSMNVTFVPRTLWRGARIYFNANVSRVTFDGRRADGVLASGTGPEGRRVRLRARKAVVVAASTVQSPQLLRRSGIKNRHLGEHFQVHPGLALLGLFADPIDMSFGATQGAESVAYRKERFKIEAISMPPGLVLARMPGVGPSLLERMRDYSHVAMWSIQVRGEAEGRVGRTLFGRERVTYSPTPRDMMTARYGLSVLARLFFDAGAREVWPGVHGLPPTLAPSDVGKVLGGPTDARAYSFIATHLFGAARMGPDAASGVVDGDGLVYGTEGLYLVDSSVFPTNLGVNPQHTIMAIASLLATRLADRMAR